MGKLTPKQVKKLSEIGIKATDDKLAKSKLIEFLEKNDIEGVDDYEIDQLIEMAEVFYEPTDEVEEEDGVEEEDDDDEEVDEEEDDDDDQFAPMDRTELKQFIAKNKLEVVVKKSMVDEDIRDLIRAEVNSEDEEEELDDTPPTPKKPASKPLATKKAKVVESEEDLLDAVVEEVKTKSIDTKQKKIVKDEVKKDNKNNAGRKTELAGEKWNGRKNKQHLKMKDAFIEEFFSEEEFQIDILKQGFTIRALGNNAKTTIFNFDELRIVDDKLVGNLYCNRFKSVDDLCDFLQEEFQEPDKTVGMFRGESHPCIRKMSQDEVFAVFSSNVMKEALKRSNITDVKMGKNREKLEETLKSSDKKAKK